MLRSSHCRNFLAVVAMICLANTSTVAQTTVTVQLLGGNTFSPADVTIQVGDTVQWEWVAGNHNVESGTVVSGAGVPDSNFRSGNPTPIGGTTYDLLFDQAFLDANSMAGNVYPYYCDPHAGVGMIGSVTVQAASACNADADCSDADACNGVETCQSGSCVSGTALNCDDGNACTDDWCDERGCCYHQLKSECLDDGLFCNGTEGCVNLACTHSNPPCPPGKGS